MKKRILLLFILGALNGYSQDYHHWAEHFGARASLLGGAATAGLGDNATVYYNPASMAFVDDPSLSVSVNAYKYRLRKMENALGPDLDLKENQFSSMPNLIAGIMEFKNAPRVRFGYAVLTRRAYSSKFDYLHEGDYEILSTVPGPEHFIGSYNSQHELNEYWAGFGLSLRLSDSWSIGFSHFGIYRDVKYSNALSAQVLPSNGWAGEKTSFSTNVNLNYWNIKGVFKPSISLSVENFKFGIAFTTPSFNMLGRATAYRDFDVINLDEEDYDLDLTIIQRAEGMKAQHKENGSLAIGVSWKLGENGWLHFTNETFFGGKYYKIFEASSGPTLYPDTAFTQSEITKSFGNQRFIALGEETVARTNLGMGLEVKLGRTLEMYTGARTDFMYNERPYYTYDRITIDASKHNNYHFSLGFVKTTKKEKRITVGFEYGLSPRRRYYSLINYTNPKIENVLMGGGSDKAFSSQHSFKLIFEMVIGKPKI